MEIRKLDIDIEDLEKKIEDKKQVYEKEEKDKDEAINNQSLLFQEMTVRFQHILENTLNFLVIQDMKIQILINMKILQ